jgi:membrane protease YdiL (CAAX protease family)
MQVPVLTRSYRTPILDFRFDLTVRDKKVLAVALATLVFLGLQMGVSLPIAFVACCFTSALTYLGEKYIRISPEQQNDWFNVKFDKKLMTFWSAFAILRPIIIRIVCLALGIPLPGMAQEGVVKAILSRPWFMIPLATVIAPIVEEILFRGFLMERFEDLTHLLNRHKICRLSASVQQKISNLAQAIIFGAIHLRNKIEEGMALPIFFALSLHGYVAGMFKKKDQSLISPIVTHSANNIGAVIQILS